MHTNCIRYDSNFLASLQQSQSHRADSTFRTGSYQDELTGAYFGEKSFYSRLVEWVEASLVQNNLSVASQYIGRQVGVVVGGKGGVVAEQCVRYLFLSLCAVDAVVDCVAAVIVIIRVNFAGRDYGDISISGPGHHSANMCQDPSVVSYAGVTVGKEEVSLGVDIYENLSAL